MPIRRCSSRISCSLRRRSRASACQLEAPAAAAVAAFCAFSARLAAVGKHFRRSSCHLHVIKGGDVLHLGLYESRSSRSRHPLQRNMELQVCPYRRCGCGDSCDPSFLIAVGELSSLTLLSLLVLRAWPTGLLLPFPGGSAPWPASAQLPQLLVCGGSPLSSWAWAWAWAWEEEPLCSFPTAER